eukprot:scaffold34673_cov175-Amphora_coffeaeformis.AAC.3
MSQHESHGTRYTTLLSPDVVFLKSLTKSQFLFKLFGDANPQHQAVTGIAGIVFGRTVVVAQQVQHAIGLAPATDTFLECTIAHELGNCQLTPGQGTRRM